MVSRLIPCTLPSVLRLGSAGWFFELLDSLVMPVEEVYSGEAASRIELSEVLCGRYFAQRLKKNSFNLDITQRMPSFE